MQNHQKPKSVYFSVLWRFYFVFITILSDQHQVSSRSLKYDPKSKHPDFLNAYPPDRRIILTRLECNDRSSICGQFQIEYASIGFWWIEKSWKLQRRKIQNKDRRISGFALNDINRAPGRPETRTVREALHNLALPDTNNATLS